MTDNLLFGYSVEEKDDTFVITLAGKLAVPIMQDIAAQSGGERGSVGGVARLFPYSLLASQAVRLMQHGGVSETLQEKTTLEDIFAQGFDRDLDEFERQLVRYQGLLPVAARDATVSPQLSGEGDDASRSKKTAVKTANP